jgi:hypothetical protein
MVAHGMVWKGDRVDPKVQTLLSVWGAALSTILGLVQIIKQIQDTPRIRLASELAFSPIEENADVKGTKVLTSHGWQEVLLGVRVANHGRRAIQITSCIVEESGGSVTQIIPVQLPVVLDPGTLVELKIQKEFLDDPDVSRFGVVDALGRVHQVRDTVLRDLVRRCRELPTNRKKYRNEETGEVVHAFQAKDKTVLSNHKKRL